jgi:hypothetical protein
LVEQIHGKKRHFRLRLEAVPVTAPKTRRAPVKRTRRVAA